MVLRRHTEAIRASLAGLVMGVAMTSAALAFPTGAAPPPTPQGPLANTPAQVVNVTDPRWNGGAKGDGVTDDWQAIQMATGYTAGTAMNPGGCPATSTQQTVVEIPPTATNVYMISQAIRLCPNTRLIVRSDSTTIKCTASGSGTDYTGATYTSGWPNNACILAGTALAVDISAPGFTTPLPTYALTGGVAPGQTSFTFATSGNSALFVAGDVVTVEDAVTTFQIGSVVEPASLRLVKVLTSSAGVITVDRPIDFSAASGQIRKFSNLAGSPSWNTLINQNGQNTNIPMFAASNCGVKGGNWVSAGPTPNNQIGLAALGAIDCDFEPRTFSGGYGIGETNLVADSTFAVDHEWVSTKTELAFGSTDVTVKIGDMTLTGARLSQVQGGFAVAIDENSHRVHVDVKQIEDWTGGLIPEIVYNGTTAGGDAVTATLSSPIFGGVGATFNNSTPTIALPTGANYSVNYAVGTAVVFGGTSAPTGITFGATYYVVVSTSGSIEVSATPQGTAIQVSTAGSGVNASAAVTAVQVT